MAEIEPTKRIYRKSKMAQRLLGEEILALRNRGVTMFEISQKIGIGESTAYRALDTALKSRVSLQVDEFRIQQNDALDQIERDNEQNITVAEALITEGIKKSWASQIEKGVNLRQNGINTRIRIAERRAKLNGLDAPVKIEATVQTVDPKAQELADIIAKLKTSTEEGEPA